ncbi:PH domain-containing protein [Candidatus Azambacteria bacterium]|nr:PH domain-containing protein [Candidatus Azambacteria bacterium]
MLKTLFSIFTESHNTFEGQEKDENVIVLLRRHPFYILLQVFFSIILFIAPILGALVFAQFILQNNLLGLFLFLYSLWCLIGWQVLFYSITLYTLDVWIVTNKRIIDSNQIGFFNRITSELHLDKIQDVSVRIEGLIPTFFQFGDLEVQTAGTEEKFKFFQIPNPLEVKNKIMSIFELISSSDFWVPSVSVPDSTGLGVGLSSFDPSGVDMIF